MSRCTTCHCSPCRCDMFSEQRPPGTGGNTPSCWPMRSEALAVHPEQIPDALERNKRHGVTGVSYDAQTGEAILADRRARCDLMKLEGCHDNNGGYGDDHATGSPLPPRGDDSGFIE